MRSWMANQTKRGCTILVVALVTLLLLAACAPAPTTLPVEGKKVEVIQP